MSVPLKWSVKDCASTLYACGFTLDEADKLHKIKKKDSKQKKQGDEIKQPDVGDKDFIVFKFKEDGEINRMKEEKSAINHNHWIEEMKHDCKCLKEFQFSENSEGLEHGLIISEAEEMRRTNCNNEWPKFDENADANVMRKVEESAELQALSDSRSDSSSGSFAFPIMKLEMERSPQRMPSKVNRSLHLPCCGRF